MKKLYTKLLIAVLSLLTFSAFSQSDLVITGLISAALPQQVPKAVEIYVINDVADLSEYGIANANNGNPSGGVPKLVFPAVSASAGTFIYVASEEEGFTTFFGFAPTYLQGETQTLNVNGDDVIELYHNGVVVDYAGQIGESGTNIPWQYQRGWMYRNNGMGPNTTFTLSEWTFSGMNALQGASSNASADTPMPIGTYSPEAGGEDPDPDVVTIVEIQQTEDASGDSPYVGQLVTTSGIVTAVTNDGFWIQDGEGAWTGIFVRVSGTPTVQMGDDITLTGTVQENFGLTRLNSISNLITNSTGNALPNPTPLTTGAAGVEEYESVLISIANATCINNDLGFGEWAINDGSGPYRVAPEMYDVNPQNFTTYDLIGIAHYSFDDYKLLPRNEDDVTAVGDETGLSFEVSTLNVNETDGTITVNVEITNPAATPTTVEVAVTGGTAQLGTHFNFDNPTTLTFEANATESQSFTFDVIDDDEANENRTIQFELQNASSGAMFGISTLNVTIIDDDTEIEITPIGIVGAVDDQGVAIHQGETFTVTGIVHGVNMNGNGLQFTIIDGTGGIGTYSPQVVDGYVVTEGDSLILTGTVDQFNGLTQLSFLSNIILVSQGHATMDPIVVTELNEDLESLLVKVECVYIVDLSKWTNSGSGFNIKVTDGADLEMEVRIDNDVEMFGGTPPEGTFNLTGIVGQFKSSAPYFGGYQIIPRYWADFEDAECDIDVPLVNDNCSGAINLNYLMGGEIDEPQLSTIYSNIGATAEDYPGNGWECFGEPDGSGSAPSLEAIVWFSFTGDGETYFIETNNCNNTADDYIPFGDTQMAIYTGICDFTTPVLCSEDGPNATGNDYAAGAELTTVEGESYLMMIDGFDGAQGEFCIQFTKKEGVGLADANGFDFKLYPNPAQDKLIIKSAKATKSIAAIDVLGKVVKKVNYEAAQEMEMNVNDLKAGVYIIQVLSTDNHISTQKVIVE